jgi:outer membrane lipoprotein-sorting protein
MDSRFKMLPAVMLIVAALLGGVFATNTIAQTETSTSISGGFADVQTVQNDNYIVITVTKAGAEAPSGPVVVVPAEPNATDDGGLENGTIITPGEPTEGNETDVIVIEPDGNVTQVPGNVTNIDNSTVIIAPTNQTVSETPGGVVVVDPPVCGCPSEPVAPEDATTTVPAEEEEELPTNDTITIEPAPSTTETNDTNGGGNDTNGGGVEDNSTANPLLDTLGLQS